MTINLQLLRIIEKDSSGKQALEFLQALDEQQFSDLLAAAWQVRQDNFDPVLDCFIPGNKFPAISITGTQCALQCKHCNRHYLSLMIQAETPTKLWDVCQELDRDGKVGCLISGGYNDQAMLPFTEFLPTIRRIKEETNLILNVHTGLVNEAIAFELGDAGVDIGSFDIVGDKQTSHEVYGLSKTPEDYLHSLEFLNKSKIPFIVPHVCIGLNQGMLSGEIRALSLLKSISPYLIVLLGLIPTVDTSMQDKEPPTAQTIAKIIATTRLLFPRTPLSLGCMRPGKKLRNQIDRYAIQAGINRIEIPTLKSIQFASERGLQIQRHESCCAVPLELL